MSDWKERLKKEYDELCEKVEKLRNTSLNDLDITEEHKDLLRNQFWVMKAYRDILEKRLGLE